MIIPRDRYLKQLQEKKGNGLVKVVAADIFYPKATGFACP